MKFSVFTVGTPDLTIPQVVQRLKHHGYDAVEWRVSDRPEGKPNPMPPRELWYWGYNQCTLRLSAIDEEAKMAKSLSDEAGLEISSLSTYLRPEHTGEIVQVLQTAQAIDCPRIRLMCPSYRGETDYNKLFSETKTHLATVEKMAAEYGVKVVLEMHHDTIIPSASAAHRLVSDFDSKRIGVIYDSGNMVHEGYERYTLGITLLGEYLDYVHIKDARPIKPSEDKGWTVEWCPLGEGMVNFPALMTALRSSGYQGYLSVEDFSNQHGTEEKLAHNISYIKSMAGL